MKFTYSCFVALLATVAFTSCSSDDDAVEESISAYAGKYQIVSFESDIAVDLNKDNVASYELVDEINSFNFSELEVRPYGDIDNKAKLLCFGLPKMYMTFEYPSEPEGYAQFSSYGFVTMYEFDVATNTFLMENHSYTEQAYIDNVESNREVTFTSDLVVVDATHLQTSIAKEYYDFITQEWVMLHINVLFEKQF
ncbi:hypothetical protein SAMN05216480_10455 [Pustulibacterium marinum]|uniref:Lipocalin-like domain-containing protein n=1 Tax=Pustulibacterium marinum TaxID=1224947 RepID=A0A1I7GB59_9FLAO|nr:hypothetical protein [Pustulibacterium marinum]SFU45664.1 hypothetical protein SAMN05216480_10455 [Pustulibacterium marinum]